MSTYLMIFQGLISALLIFMVLIQFGKGAEAGLLTGASDSVFSSSQQGNILTKITVVLAVLFLGNSLLLARIQSHKNSSSIMDTQAPVTAPAQAPIKAKANQVNENTVPSKTINGNEKSEANQATNSDAITPKATKESTDQ